MRLFVMETFFFSLSNKIGLSRSKFFVKWQCFIPKNSVENKLHGKRKKVSRIYNHVRQKQNEKHRKDGSDSKLRV